MAAPKLFKASEVCELARVQPYVLRSWEKEFPGIGVQKQPDGPRLYRQADVDQVLRIKQLVFTEGLTLAGARRRLDEGGVAFQPAEPELETVGSDPSALLDGAAGHDVRQRIQQVRSGLQSILDMLSQAPSAAALPEFDLRPPTPPAPPVKVRAAVRTAAHRPSPKSAKRKRAHA